MSVTRTVRCDACGQIIYGDDMTYLSSAHWRESFEFCDLNCVEDWLKSRYRQKQGDKLAITTIDKPGEPKNMIIDTLTGMRVWP